MLKTLTVVYAAVIDFFFLMSTFVVISALTSVLTGGLPTGFVLGQLIASLFMVNIYYLKRPARLFITPGERIIGIDRLSQKQAPLNRFNSGRAMPFLFSVLTLIILCMNGAELFFDLKGAVYFSLTDAFILVAVTILVFQGVIRFFSDSALYGLLVIAGLGLEISTLLRNAYTGWPLIFKFACFTTAFLWLAMTGIYYGARRQPGG